MASAMSSSSFWRALRFDLAPRVAERWWDEEDDAPRPEGTCLLEEVEGEEELALLDRESLSAFLGGPFRA